MSEYSDCRRDFDVEAYVEHEESNTELDDIGGRDEKCGTLRPNA